MSITRVKNKNYELSAYESFIKDVYDPIEFKKTFINVMRPRKDGSGFDKVKFQPYWYQNAWTLDDSMLKYTAKSRQIGFSFNEMVDSLHKAITTPNYLKMFVSLTQQQANELLRIIVNTVNIMDDEWKIPFVSKRDSILEFENGARLIALPTKDMAGRSYHGDIFLDEFAFIPNDVSLLDGILQGSVREGYKVAMGSTPYGQRGEFHNVLKQSGWDTTTTWENPKDIKLFLRMYNKFLQTNESEWAIHLIPWWACPDLKYDRIRARAKTNESFKQEYGIGFLDDTTAMIGYQLMLDHMDEQLYQFIPTKSPNRVAPSRITAGLDPAERRNQTAFVVFEKIGNVFYKRYKEVWIDKDHTIYNEQIRKYMKRWNIHHLYVDSTGLGAPVLADLQKNIPSKRVTGVKFNNNNKLDMINNLVYLYEAGKNSKDYLIWTDYDTEYFDQLHQLRRERTKTGKERFTGKIEGKDDDIIWATALALIENIDFEKNEVMFANANYTQIDRRQNTYGFTKYY